MDFAIKVEEIKQQTGKSIFSLDEAAQYLGVTEKDITSFISNGELKALGETQIMIRLFDLIAFEVGEIALEKKRELGAHTYNEDITFGELVTLYFEKIDGATQSRTFGNNLALSRHIIDKIGYLKASEIDKDTLQKFINGFANKTYSRGKNGVSNLYYSQSTINKVFDILHGIIQDGVDSGLFPYDYTQKFKKPSSKRYMESKPKALSDYDVTLLISSVSNHPLLNTYIHILLYTGMRPSEALALKAQDINFDRKTISITKTLSYRTENDIQNKKIGKQIPIIKNLKNETNGKRLYRMRILKVSDKVLTVIREWIELLNSNDLLTLQKKENNTVDFLFTGVNGQLVVSNYYFQLFERLLLKKGLTYKQYFLYRFRHNFCTRALRQGFDPKIVQALMGDETLEMVLRVYDSINESEIIKASGEFAQNMDYTLGLDA